MSYFYVNSIASAMRHAAPTFEKHGVSQPDFLDFVKSSFNDLGVTSGMSEGVKSLGKHGDGREGALLGTLSSPAAGAVLAANEASNSRG